MIDSLTLVNYRNFENTVLQLDKKKSNYIIARNGSGKTNLLEAISNFAIGSNLLSSTDIEMLAKQQNSYKLYLKCIETNYSFLAKINYKSKSSQSSKKEFLIDNKTAKKRDLLDRGLVLFWLTQEFTQEITSQKNQLVKLVDRLIYHFNSAHMKRIRDYQKLISLRLDGLRKDYDIGYLSSLEEEIAKIITAIVASRIKYSQKLNKIISKFDTPLCNATIQLEGELSEIFDINNSYQIEKTIIEKLRTNRELDHKSNKTNFGLSKNIMILTDSLRKLPSKMTSTAEKKIASMAVGFACLEYIRDEISVEGYILLDEIFANLDHEHFNQLHEIIQKSKFPFIITANEREFNGITLPKSSNIITIKHNGLVYNDCLNID